MNTITTMRTMNRQDGFNVLELMISLVIAGLVLGFGIPSFTAFIANNRMATAANDLVTTIHVARTEAVKRRQIVTICASDSWADDAPDCDVGGGAGWIVITDANGSVSVDGDDTVLLTHAPMAQGIDFDIDAGASFYIQYAGSGFPQTAAAGTPITNIQLCDERGNVSTGGSDEDDNHIAAGRWIAISPTGRPQLYRMQNDVQGNPVGGC